MAIRKTPDLSQSVTARARQEATATTLRESAARALEKHVEQQAQPGAAQAPADGISGPTQDFSKVIGDASDAPQLPVSDAPTHSPLFVRNAVVGGAGKKAAPIIERPETVWPAREDRPAVQAAALAGPTTVEAFEAAGVVGHKHTEADKKALLELVKANVGEDKAFGNPDDSYYGMHTFLLEGAAGAHAVAFTQANLGRVAELDPEKHSVLLTIKSFDEAEVGVFVVDREKQQMVFAAESNAVDYDGDAFSAFFPEAGRDVAPDAFVIGTLARRGELLEVLAGENPPDDMNFGDWLDDA